MFFLTCVLFLLFIHSGIPYKGEQNDNLLQLNNFSNHTTDGCVWKTLYGSQQCPESGVKFYFYAEHEDRPRVEINPLETSTLQGTLWDPHKHNVIYIHGYDSSDEALPTTILRNAYLRNGSYNVFIVDWSPYAKMPCYASAVHNVNAVAKCTAQLYKNLRSQGIPSHRVTCVGHSLGAHACGLISKHIDFRINRIIGNKGLDPSGPMVPHTSKLKSGMANYVQAVYTNAGTFADTIANGRINFCMNGGKMQPMCLNTTFGPDLCSHLMSICYMAESIDSATARWARPCSRQCPFGLRKGQGPGRPVFVGQLAPDRVTGSYCAYSTEPPYCSKTSNGRGHPWCCPEKI